MSTYLKAKERERARHGCVGGADEGVDKVNTSERGPGCVRCRGVLKDRRTKRRAERPAELGHHREGVEHPRALRDEGFNERWCTMERLQSAPDCMRMRTGRSRR